jgi:hypothetical protein
VDPDEARRADAAAVVRDALGIEPTEDALFARLAGQLAADEVAAAAAAVDRAADRRHMAVAAFAAASLAMDRLGVAWWHQVRVRTGVTGVPADNRSPATLIRSGASIRGLTPMDLLDAWAGDDVADHMWGPPVGYVDMHSGAPLDRVPAPEHSRPGDRLLLAWDPGCRVWAVVQERGDGRLGTRLDGDLLYGPTCELWENWLAATRPGS